MEKPNHSIKPERGGPRPPVPGGWTRSVWGVGLLCVLLAVWPERAKAVTFRWSSNSYRIYVSGPGSATLSDIKAALPKVPLEQVSPGVWHLRAELQVDSGGRLALHGTKLGGDVNQLRLQSNNTFDTNNIVFLSADYGTLDIRSTSITSWDDAVDGPDTEYSTYRRAFIRVRSSLDPDGVTPHESRMDIVDSDIGYLGSHNAESYGLVYKVIPGHTNYAGTLSNLYVLVNVYGDILRSHLHNNFFGVYTFGAFGMHMAENEVDHNIGYGFDPHDDSDQLVIENNNVHHNGWHGIIASQRCDHLIIRNNVSWQNGRNGIMLHRYCDDSLIENNRSVDNGDSGIALFDTYRTTVRGNTCLGNGMSGLRCSVGASDNLIVSNEFAFGASMGLYLYKGVDAPKPGDDGRPKRNQFVRNLVHDNLGSGIYVTSADDNSFVANVFAATTGPFWFINSQRSRLDSNSLPNTVSMKVQGMPSLPSTLLVRNEPAVPAQVDPYSSITFDDPLGRMFDPQQSGEFATVTPGGTTLTLTGADFLRSGTVFTRNLLVVPDAGVALVSITIWNTTGDLSKRWLVQAGSTTHILTYRVGDLAPNRTYTLQRNGVATRITSDDSGWITYQDKAVTTGLFEYILTPF